MRLSKSQLDKFIGCPRCFWLAQNHKLKQPDMISSKVWKGVERLTIAHYEAHRIAKTTPENLVGQVPDGAIPYQGDRITLKELRYWGKGLRFDVDGVEVSTALDDMLQIPDGAQPSGSRYAVVDYKSKSRLTDEESTSQMYQTQANVYDLACNINGYPTDGMVYFDYSSPVSIEGAEPAGGPGDVGYTMQKWASQVIALKADHAAVKNLVVAAAACLESAMPEPGAECTVCQYLLDREELFKALEAAPV